MYKTMVRRRMLITFLAAGRLSINRLRSRPASNRDAGSQLPVGFHISIY
jgi:hypothetical protein